MGGGGVVCLLKGVFLLGAGCLPSEVVGLPSGGGGGCLPAP